MVDMNPMVKGAVAVGLVAIICLVVQSQMAAAESAQWDHLAEARAAGFTVEALEDARAQAEGTDVEPWCSFYLAMELYKDGEDLDRARQIAAESVEKFKNHATTPMLAALLEALKTYSPS